LLLYFKGSCLEFQKIFILVKLP